MNQIIIFTDGSSSGNPGPGGWGVIVACPAKDKATDPDCEDSVMELGGHEDKTTNNRMELKAAIQALKSLGDTGGNVVVHTDSSYVIQGITKWVKGWSKNNWMTGAKKAVLNQDLWQELMSAVDEREKHGNITWKLVEGHAGIPGNERVDTIATAYTENRMPELYNGPRSKYPINLLSTIANRTKKVVKQNKRARTSAKAYSYVSLVDRKIMTHKTWQECEARVKGKKAKFKKALSKSEEETIIREFSV
jgi:ribonuclease HI